MNGIYRYVRLHDVDARLSEGWTVAADLGPTHGSYSTLMKASVRQIVITKKGDEYKIAMMGLGEHGMGVTLDTDETTDITEAWAKAMAAMKLLESPK